MISCPSRALPNFIVAVSASVLASATVLTSTDAHAAYPDDVVLSGLDEWNGTAVSPEAANTAYQQVVKQLAVGIANKPMAPAETLGINGFAVSLDSGWGFITADHDDAAPSPWQRVHEDGDPTRILWVPSVTARKGLPFSLEIGGTMGYVGFSQQTVFGGFARWGVWEGYRNAPDLSVKLGYSGLVGNDELELGVLDFSGSIGYTIPFGTLIGVNEAQFAPYLGAGLLRFNASPRFSTTQMADIGISSASGFSSKENFVEGFSPFAGHVGFRIVTGDITVTIAGMGAIGVMPTVNMGFGYDF